MSILTSGSRRTRTRLLLWLALAVLCAALALCWVVGARYERARQPREAEIPLTEEEMNQEFPLLALTRADRETGDENAQTLDLSEYQGECVIREGGVYVLSGSLDGVIRIEAEEQTVHLVLDSVTVVSSNGPALLVESAGKVILTLPEYSESTLSDTGHYPKGAEAEACVWSSADLTINGTGALTVNGLYKDAIRSKNVVRVVDGEITIKCKRSGIHGTDGILVAGGRLSISSEKYGLRTVKSGADGRGNLVVSGGEHRIIAGRHAFLVSRGDLYVYNCKVSDNSIVSTASVGGRTRIQSGCFE